MSYTMYSFKDIIGEIATNLTGNFAINSAQNTSLGIGSIALSMANDLTIHDIGVDGSIIIWPVAVYNGTISITMQQTSLLHSFLLQWCADLKNALTSSSTVNTASGPTTGSNSQIISGSTGSSYTQTNGAQNWASTSIILQSVKTGMPLHTITGVSPQKIADKSYSAQGGNVVWNLMAGNIESYAGSLSI